MTTSPALPFDFQANYFLLSNFAKVFPGMGYGAFRKLGITSDNDHCEFDSYAYMSKDYLGRPVEQKGIRVVIKSTRHGDVPEKAPLPAPKLNRMSESCWGEKDFGKEGMVKKFLVGALYSGRDDGCASGKIHQLENKLQFVRRLHIQDGADTSDITQSVGAAVLCFSTNGENRSTQLNKYSKLVTHKLNKASHPLLWRLMRARRLIVVVLPDQRAESTHIATYRKLASNVEDVDELDDDISAITTDEALDDDESSEETTLKSDDYTHTKLDKKLDALKASQDVMLHLLKELVAQKK